MKKTVGYYFIMALTWPMQLFPLEFHFLFSDLLYLLTYRIVGYRKKVVAENLLKSFPEKTDEERKIIERKFYHHLNDLFIEVLYIIHVSPKWHAKRMTYENTELVNELYDKNKSVICVMGHYGNWDFGTPLPLNIKHPVYAIYKKMGILMFDQFYKKVRGKDGIELIEMSETYRWLITDKQRDKKILAVLIADQRPLFHEIKFWMPFLGQDTPVIVGPEKIAKKTNSAVVYSEFQKVKRGYYKQVFKLITEDAPSEKEFEITRRCMEELEKSIRERPEFWLWSHKRWKHKRKNKSC